MQGSEVAWVPSVVDALGGRVGHDVAKTEQAEPVRSAWVRFARKLKALRAADGMSIPAFAEAVETTVGVAARISNPNSITGPIQDEGLLQRIAGRWPDDAELQTAILEMAESVPGFERAQASRKRAYVAQTLRPCEVPKNASAIARAKAARRNEKIVTASDWIGKRVELGDGTFGVAEKCQCGRSDAVFVRFDDGTGRTVWANAVRRVAPG